MPARRTSTHRPIASRRAPRPVGVGALAVRVEAPGPQLFVGQILPVELPRGRMSQAPAARQAELVLGHLRAVLADGGFVMDEVVEVTIYFLDLADLAAFDLAWAKFFVSQAQVARSLAQVAALPEAARVGLRALAVKPLTAPAAAPPAPAEDEEGWY